MKTGTQFLLLLGLLGLFSTSAVADGIPPSQEDVCDVLQLPGSTPGLFGLCNAYCEAKDCDSYPEGEQPKSCERLLANYDRRADESELPIPCLREDEPDDPTCPCWSSEDLNVTLPPDFCINDGANGVNDNFDVASYFDGVDYIEFFTDAQGCMYMNSQQVDDEGFPLERMDDTSEDGENEACRNDIRDVLHADFGGSANCPVQW